jgi:peroxiredoxin
MMKRSGIPKMLLAAIFVLGSIKLLLALGVGDKAPDFTLPATTQEKWALSDHLGKKNIVLFAFVGAFTST